MHLKSGIQAALGLAVLALGGTAMAQTTNLNQTTGDVFLNIVDTTNNTSFVFDTGLSQASFSGTGSYSYNLGSNSTYEQFVAAEGGSDVVDYSVLSATGGGTTGTQILFTTNAALPTGRTATNVTTAEAAINGFMLGAALPANNQATTPVTGYAILNSSYTYGAALTEGVVSAQLLNNSTAPYADNAAVGTALNFYDTSVSAGRSGTYNGVSAEAGTWKLSSAGLLTYGAAVPLPTPLLLLLSGLGFMGVVARRNRTA
jgi:hypothetical protein